MLPGLPPRAVSHVPSGIMSPKLCCTQSEARDQPQRGSITCSSRDPRVSRPRSTSPHPSLYSCPNGKIFVGCTRKRASVSAGLPADHWRRPLPPVATSRFDSRNPGVPNGMGSRSGPRAWIGAQSSNESGYEPRQPKSIEILNTKRTMS